MEIKSQLNQLLRDSFEELDIKLNDFDVNQFVKYKDLLLDWNTRINLAAITDEEDIIIKHFADSVSCLKTGLFPDNCKVIDVGTGAGFPGIPIKLVRSDIKITLLDSLNKRIIFLNEIIKDLKLKSISAIHGRAEDIGILKEHREEYDIAVSRAVAALNVLVEYSLPFVKVGGYFISMKGPDVQKELDLAKNAVSLLGGEVEDVLKVHLPKYEYMHSIIIVKKVRQCSTKYPRKAGKPAKDPIN